MTFKESGFFSGTTLAPLHGLSRRPLSRFVTVSAISGGIWAVIACFVATPRFGLLSVAGLLASPLIGIAVGLLYRPADAKSPLARVGMPLVTLYVAAALFGTTVGIFAFLLPGPGRFQSEVVLVSVLMTLSFLTFKGLFVVLWPLSFLNHWLVDRLTSQRPTSRRQTDKTFETPDSSSGATLAPRYALDGRLLRRVVMVSAMSGCIWAGIAYFLASPWMGTPIVSGLLASPLIGIGVALLYRSANAKSPLSRMGMSLFTLYVAAALFGTVVGTCVLMGPSHDHFQSDIVLDAVIVTLWGLTFKGLFVFLWPLSFLNHWLVERFSDRSRHYAAASTQ